MAVRNSDDILVGGARVFIIDGEEKKELGYMSGEFKVEEQASNVAIKESEGSTVTTIATDKEVHLTFSMLECNLDTLMLLNPSATPLGEDADGKGFAVGTYQSEKTYQIEVWHKKRSGKYLCSRLFKGKVSGNFTSFLLNQDNASPISIDIVAIGDDTKATTNNIYEQFECEAAKAPGGGW
jgi:hypothetical protein